MLELAQRVTLSHVSENWEGFLTEETMLVTVRGHIFPFTKQNAMNQLLMKKIYLWAPFFFLSESHICMWNDDEWESHPSFRTLNFCSRLATEGMWLSCLERQQWWRCKDQKLLSGFFPWCFIDSTITFPHLWEKVMVGQGTMLSHSWVKLHLCVSGPKSPFVGRQKQGEIGRPIQKYSGIFVVLWCFFTLPGVSLKMN